MTQFSIWAVMLIIFTISSIVNEATSLDHPEVTEEHALRYARHVQAAYCNSIFPFVTIKDAEVFQTSTKVNIYLSTGVDVVSNFIRERGWWEIGHTNSVKRALEASALFRRADHPVFIDIGANIGWYSLNVAHDIADVEVIAFEAMHQNAALIRSSICANAEAERKITLVNHALGKEKLHCDVVGAPGNTQNGMLKCGKDGNPPDYKKELFVLQGTTSVVRLDSVLNMDIDVIKMDVEGFEPFVLEGANKLFKNHYVGYILMEYNQDMIKIAGGDGIAMLRQLIEWGFSCSKKSFDGPWLNQTELDAFVCPPEVPVNCNVYLRNKKTM